MMKGFYLLFCCCCCCYISMYVYLLSSF